MPRRRPRAPRLSRMDAAVDAMLPYGFPEEVVKKHVKQLLKAPHNPILYVKIVKHNDLLNHQSLAAAKLQEYGGDVGWPFIEECSYTVLLDSILDGKDNQEHEPVAESGNLLEGCDDRASNGDMVPSSTCTEAVSIAQEPHTVLRSEAEAAAADGLPAQSPPLESTNMELPASRQRRFPCYGWIESDGDDYDENDFIVLRPHPCMAFGGRATLDVTTWRKKRRSRWDVKPGDP